jgi:hypothetical protein
MQGLAMYACCSTGGSLERKSRSKVRWPALFSGVDDALARLTYVLVVQDRKSHFFRVNLRF